MTDLFRIRVVRMNKSKRQIVFRVYLVYYDGGDTDVIPNDPSFFYLILAERPYLLHSITIMSERERTNFILSGENEPEILNELKEEAKNLYRSESIQENVKKYIEQVKLTHISERKIHKNEGRFYYSGFKNEKALKQGVYEVTVTDDKWFKHLKPGMVWQTAAFDSLKGTSGVPFTSHIVEEEPKPQKKTKKAAVGKDSVKATKPSITKKRRAPNSDVEKASGEQSKKQKLLITKTTKKSVTKEVSQKKPIIKATRTQVKKSKPLASNKNAVKV
jgi:hypothetical protein